MRVKGISNIDNNNTQMNTYKSKERGERNWKREKIDVDINMSADMYR